MLKAVGYTHLSSRMAVLERYKYLCDEFLVVAELHIDDKKLCQIKQQYAHVIASRRQLSNISDLKALLRLLEKRDILNYKDINPLHDIAQRYVRNFRLENTIQSYKDWCRNNSHLLDLGNMYLDRSVNPTNLQEDETSDHIKTSCSLHIAGHSPPTSHQENVCRHHRIPLVIQQNVIEKREDKLQQKVLLAISERLGRTWRDVVRHLGVTEAKIDELHVQYPNDMKEQCYQALQCWLSTTLNTDKWKIDLMHALTASRRKDVQEYVAQMLIQ